jgi:PAS domain S-box-containing protein
MFELSVISEDPDRFQKSTRSHFLWLKIFFLVLTPPFFLNSTVPASPQTEPKHVLVLFSFRPTSPVAGQWSRGIQSVFKPGPSPGIKVDFEYLDIARFNDDQYLKMLLDVYRYKYSKLKPNLIITVNDPSLDFMLEYGADLFAGVPVVFTGVEQDYIKRQSIGTNTTGILSRGTYRETLDLALKLHPGTRHVTVVADSGRAGRAYINAGREVFKKYEDRIDFTYLVGLPMKDILEEVANLSGQTFVIYLPVIVDGAGKKFVAPESLSLVSQASAVPVYSCWEVLLGHGIVGGYLSSFEVMGRTAAELGLRVLNGENIDDIPLVNKPAFDYMFDWRQLKLWKINEDKLPRGSIIKLKELTVWERYKGRIIGAVSLIIFQTLIILLLLHQRRLRRQTEYELKDRLQFENKLSELSSEFINLSSEKLDSKMIDALAWIGPFMGADRSHIFRFNWDRTEFRITHLWEAEGTKKDEIVLPGLIVKDAFPWLFDNLTGGRDVIVPDIEMLSNIETGNEYRYCRELGIQSFIILPIEIENAPLCAIGLDSIRQKRQWPQEIQDRLRIIGEIFANTIVRRHAEKKSEVDALRYRTVVDFTYDWEYWQKPDGSFQYVSPSCERICGYSAQDLMTNPSLLQDMIAPEDKAAWDEHRCNNRKEMRSEEIQFRIQRPDGEIRWIEHVCQSVFDSQGNNQGIRASNRDITKRAFYRSETHKLQSELAHMDRVVTISTLTAALAHEINQPLAAMRSYAQAALRFMDKDQPEYDSVRKALQGIVADNKRAAEVVNRLRDLVKKGPTHREPIEINSVIHDVIGLINSELVIRNTSLKLDLHQSAPVVQVDSIQIQQVLINLLTNALDAMDDQPVDARTIAISTRPVNSNKIVVSISDSGSGIPPDTIEAIFSPFHTTKSTGMGLGLSICKSIIDAHGGKIFAENNPDGGAIFSVTLPVDKK